jgi:hypothetical protein
VDSKSADPNKPKITKAADVDDPNSTKKRPEAVAAADPNKPKVVKAADVDDPNSTKKRPEAVAAADPNKSNVVPLADPIKSNVVPLADVNKPKVVKAADVAAADPNKSNVVPLADPIKSNVVPLADPIKSNVVPLADPIKSNVVPLADVNKPKVVKAADVDDPNSTKKKAKTSSADPIKSNVVPLADPNKPKVVKAADVDDPNSTKKRAKTSSADPNKSNVVPLADVNKPKVVKAADDTDRNSTKKRSTDIKPIKVESTDSKIKADPDKPKTVKAADIDDPNSTKKRAKVVKKAADEDNDLPFNVIKFPSKNKESSGLGSADLTEADIERGKVEDHQTDLLQQIADNTGSLKKPVGNAPEQPKDGMGLGIIGTILAGIVGSIVGLARAWVKTIKLFADALIPTELMEKIKKGFSAVEEFFSGIFSKFKSLFDFSGESKIGKIFGTIREAMSAFIKPFVTAYEVIADLLKGPVKMVEGVFTAIKEYFSVFAKTVGGVARIVEKLMFPVLIIMTIWDTVKGAIEGFAKEGIIGGIKGAITGFFNSLIFGPIDMLKDAIAWVLGFFGFDKAKEVLQSFSLEDIFKKFIDAIFSPVQMIKDMFAKVVGFFENIEIPGIGFSVLGKEFKVGPWYPFKKDAAKSPDDKKSEPIKPGNSDAQGGQGSSQQAANDPRRVDKGSDVGPNTAVKKVPNQDMSKSSISPEEAKNILENGSKRDIESFGGADKLKQIISGGAAGAKLTPSEPQTGNQVASQSAESEMAKNASTSSSSTVIAPTSNVNNSNSTTYAMKPRVRNPDEGVRRQLAQRYGT